MKCLILTSFLLWASIAWGQVQSSSQFFQSALQEQRRGDLSGAVRDYHEALQRSPNLTAAHVNLAAVYLQLNDLDNSLVEYTIAMKQSPGDVKIAVLLANCYVLRDEHRDAVQLLAPFEKTYPQNLDLEFILGDSLIHQGHLQEGLKRVEKVARLRNDANAWLLAGTTELKLNQFASATRSLDRGLQLEPTMPGARTLSGIAKMRTGDSEGAKEAFQKALEMDPNDFEASLRLGGMLRLAGDTANARPYLEHAIRLQPASPLARYQMAQLELASGHDAEAISNFEVIARAAPNILQAHVSLASLYYRMKRQEEGKRERQIVEQLMASPEKQDHQLDADPLIEGDRSFANAAPSR